MKTFYFILVSLLLISCRDSAGKEEKKQATENPELQVTLKTNTYTSQKWHFSAEIPEGFEIYEGELPGESPVINFYDPEISEAPPFGIRNSAEHAYIAILPEAFGIDAPGGPRKTFKEWEGYLPLSFEIDPEKSFVYLLENGSPWALSLAPLAPPPGWKENGSIYVFYEVENFKTECFSSNTGEKIPVADCNVSEGDAMKFYGEVSEEKKKSVNVILESLYFFEANREREELEDLIKVEQPKVEAKVSSPLHITGKAKGFWYFEATAPVTLVDEKGKVLAQKYITAKEDWMTRDWVSFEGELEFETKEKRGYLIFNRANASGKPEHDRILRIPVVFN